MYMQSKRFFTLLNSLLLFANNRYGFIDEPFNPLKQSYSDEDFFEVASEVFSNAAIIEAFVRMNPYDFEQEDLDQVLQWRHAIADTFVVMEHRPHYSVFMGADTLFGVVGLSKNIDDLVPQVPMPVETILLPFGGGIVFASSLFTYQVEMGPGVTKVFSDEYDKLSADGRIIVTAEDFMGISPAYKEAGLRRAADDLLKELEDQTTLGEDTPGMHKGVLSGLSFEEREAAIMEQMEADTPITPYLEERRRRWLIEAEPVYSLAEALALLSTDQLEQVSETVRFDAPKEASDAELAALLAEHIADRRYNIAYSLSMGFYRPAFGLGEQIYHAGGALSRDAEEEEALPAREQIAAHVPFIFTFAHDGNVTGVIPREYLEWVEEEDWNDARAESEKRDRARAFASAYLDLCGVVNIDELARLYVKHLPNDYSEDDFIDFVYFNGPDDFSQYNWWVHDGEDYLLHWNLVEEDWPSEKDDHVVIDGDKMRMETDEEMVRRYLVESHRKVEPWEPPLGSFARDAKDGGYRYYDDVASRPAYKALCQYLDAHVPDGENDYYFADRLLEELLDFVQFEPSPQRFLEYFDEEGLAFDSVAKMQECLDLVMGFANGVPRWSNNGWSPLALQERLTGKKIFADESGRPIRVGRNDPCPCGSGKKYKKCCGR